MIGGRPLVALLLVGGAGTRLWPISNDSRPKQFLKLFGDRSLFQATMVRAAAANFDHVVVITGEAHAAYVKEQITELGGDRTHVILEPARRDSAAAISAGVAWIRHYISNTSIVVVMPSDHFISDAGAFTKALHQAGEVASKGWLVTLGINPASASSEYGYIQRGQLLSIPPIKQVWKVAKFHEKPQRDVAKAYLLDSNFSWNSGIFIFVAKDFAAEAKRHMADIWEASNRAVACGQVELATFSLSRAEFALVPKNSIDYALFEKSNRVAVIPVDFAWHDIGNWSSAYDAFSMTEGSNVVTGEAVLDEVSGSIVVADGVKVIVSGLRDVVVAASPRGTFVASRLNAPAVKRLLDI